MTTIRALLKYLVLGSILTLPTSAFADWYMGLDATNLSHKIEFVNPERYDLNPTRFKIGYLGKSGFGLELQALNSSSKLSTATGNGDRSGITYRSDLDTSFGLSAIWSSSKNGLGWYGSLGYLSMDTTITNPITTSSVNDDVMMFGFGVGSYYKFSDNFKVTLDYYEYGGSARYTIFVKEANDVNIQLKGFGLGATYMF